MYDNGNLVQWNTHCMTMVALFSGTLISYLYVQWNTLLYETPLISDKLVMLFGETLTNVFKLWMDTVVLVECQQCGYALKVILHPIHVVLSARGLVNHQSELSHSRVWVSLDDGEDVIAVVAAESAEVVIVVCSLEPPGCLLP